MSRFVTTLRSQPETIRLPSVHSEQVWTVRVQCLEMWDAIRMEVEPTSPIQEIKQAAMALLMPDVVNFDEYVVKYSGVEARNERDSIESIGAKDGSILIIMSRRRRPVR